MISKNKLGIVLGGFSGLCHLVWSLLVAFGVAQFLVDWVSRFHFIHPPWVIGTFRADLAVALIVITSSIGYVMGLGVGGDLELVAALLLKPGGARCRGCALRQQMAG